MSNDAYYAAELLKSIRENMAKAWSDAAREASAQARKSAGRHMDAADKHDAANNQSDSKKMQDVHEQARVMHLNAANSYHNAADAYEGGNKQAGDEHLSQAKRIGLAANTRTSNIKQGLFSGGGPHYLD